jgi:alkanesulfonate monooxygenase
MDVYWFIPLHGDGRFLNSSVGGRGTDFGYLKQVAQAADNLGFDGALLPTGRSSEDAWIAAAMLAAVTERLKYIVAIRPGLFLPAAAARMAATFDRLSNGRLQVNIVNGADPSEMAGDGVFLSHDERYAITHEFLEIWRPLMAGETVTYKGKFLSVDKASLMFSPVQKPHPALFIGGSSDAALDVAARHVDVYLTFAEPLADTAEKIQRVRARAAEQGRSVRIGLRSHLVVRETVREAWAAANDLLRYVDAHAIHAAQERLSRHESEGQRRMLALHGGNRDRLEIAPNLWSGIGLLRANAGTALVGSPENILDRLKEYAALGIDTFIFSGYPHLEEIYRASEWLLPELRKWGAGELASRGPTHRGEYLANHSSPEVLQTSGSTR